MITTMFALSTAHLVYLNASLLHQTLYLQGLSQGCSLEQLRQGIFGVYPSPNAYFNNRALPLNLAIKYINAIVMLLGDCLMVSSLDALMRRNMT